MRDHELIWLIVGVALTAPPSFLFTLLYGLLSPWYRSRTGRAIFILSLGVSILVLSGVLRLFLGQGNVVFIYVRLGIYTVLPFGLWYLLVAYLRVLWHARSEGWPPSDDERASSRVA